jgi:hypothetical protein
LRRTSSPALGDIVPDRELEDAVLDFSLNSRTAKAMHAGGRVAEGIVFPMTDFVQAALGIDLGRGGAIGLWRITDEATWASIKAGRLPAMSLAAARSARRPAMTTAETSRPKVLRRLVIDEFSFVDAPASVGSDVLVWKHASGGAGATGTVSAAAAGNPLPLGDRLAKLEADIAAARANRRAGEALEALAKRDMPQATELLGDPDTYLFSPKVW